MVKYLKTRKNTIGLGKGVEANSTTFTDEDIEGCDPKKLELAISKGWIEKLNSTDADKLDNVGKSEEVKALEAQLKNETVRADKLEKQVAELKDALYVGWEEMTEEELAENFTIPELKDIGGTYLNLPFKGKPNEKTIAKVIVETQAKKAGE